MQKYKLYPGIITDKAVLSYALLKTDFIIDPIVRTALV